MSATASMTWAWVGTVNVYKQTQVIMFFVAVVIIFRSDDHI